MSEDAWAGSGYDAEASSGGGMWLRLKKKGEKVRLRIVSAPFRYTDTIDDTITGEKVQKRKVSWLAILKEVINGQASKRVVVFTNGPMVYGILKDLSEDENWGDPMQFDVTIERTEESGKYYVVTPLPKPIGPISDEERRLIEDANIDWPAVCTKNRQSAASNQSNSGNDPDDPFADED
jgi:hypothetical protein